MHDMTGNKPTMLFAVSDTRCERCGRLWPDGGMCSGCVSGD